MSSVKFSYDCFLVPSLRLPGWLVSVSVSLSLPTSDTKKRKSVNHCLETQLVYYRLPSTCAFNEKRVMLYKNCNFMNIFPDINQFLS